MLHELRQPQLSTASHQSDLDSSSLLEVSGVSETSPTTDQKLTLRVRHRGKVHRFTVRKVYDTYIIPSNIELLANSHHGASLYL